MDVGGDDGVPAVLVSPTLLVEVQVADASRVRRGINAVRPASSRQPASSADLAYCSQVMYYSTSCVWRSTA